MRNLTPSLILANAAQGHLSGEFDAVTLFVDTSGFTPLTVRLSAQGRDGAEVLAEILLAVFEPLVAAVYAHGGFIAGFAGDAFKAVFPTLTSESYLHALAASEQIRAHMTAHPTHKTRYGDFAFSVRMSLAVGQVTWAVWSGTTDQAAQSQGYTFFGPAIDDAIAGEDHADGGELVVTEAVFSALQSVQPTQFVGVRLVGAAAGYLRIDGVTAALPAARPTPAIEDVALAAASRFYPAPLLTMAAQGEFRPVYTLFVNVATLPTPGADDDFLPLFFQLLDQYGGYLCRIGRIGANDPGGTFLLFWGAPTSHENDLDRALSFLLDLRSQLTVPLRAGVTYSTVYAGFIGSPLREEYTCYGSSVNQAARQMTSAEWGQILLDGNTARRAEDAFDLGLAGQMRFKGFATEQPVFLLQARRQRSAATVYRGHLIGRQQELATLQAALEPLANGRFGGVVIIQGEAGIGKSRLVHELLSIMQRSDQAQPLQSFLCQTDEILRESLNPFRRFLRQYFGQLPDAGEEANKGRFTTTLDALIAVQRDPALAAELARTHSFLGALVDLQWDDSLYARLEPRQRFDNMVGALKTFLKAESRRQPLLILLEDMHWLDPDSQAFLAQLTRNVADFPFVVVATTRPLADDQEPLAALVPADVPQVMVALTTLGIDAVAELARDVVDAPIAPELIRFLAERADGNPFFVEQLLLYLQEERYLVPRAEDGALTLTLTHDQGLPTDLQSVLIARLDRLAQAVKEVVQTAAVLGREFSVQVLAQILRADLALGHKVQQAQDAAVWSALNELRYLFRHALLQNAAYAMQLQARLRVLHQIAGFAIEQLYADNLPPYYADLAHHFDRAQHRAQAIHYLQLASQQASAEYRNADVLAFTERLLSYLTAPAAIADARILRCETLMFLGRNQEALGLLHETAALVADLPDQRPRLSIMRCQIKIYWRIANKNEAVAALDVAVPLAIALQDQYELAELYHNGAAIYSGFHIDLDRALDYAEKALALYLSIGTTDKIPGALLDLGAVHRVRGDNATARDYYERGIVTSREVGNEDVLAKCYGSLAIMYALQENFPTAISWMEQALPVAQSIGATATIGDILYNLGKMYVESGQHRRALPVLEQSLAMGRETDNPKRIAAALAGIAQIHEIIDNLSEAQSLLEESLRLREAMGDRRDIGLALHNLAHLLVRRGKIIEALVYAERALPFLLETGNVGWNGRHHGWLGLIYAKLGRLPQALAQVIVLLDTVAATGESFVQGLGSLVVALVLMQPPQGEQAVDVAPLLATLAERSGVPSQIAANLAAAIAEAEAAHKYEIAIRAHCEAAHYWATRGDPTVARDHLATAKTIAQTHDLPADAAVVRRASVALGLAYDTL